MKHRILALALAMLVLTGCSEKKTEQIPTPAATEPGARITLPPDSPDPYREVIETYRSVHRTGTGNFEKGVSELVNSYDYLGYCLQDLDGNGVPELILASDGSNSDYPNIIYAVYTLHNGNAVCAVRSAARERYYMLCNDAFLMEGSNSAFSSTWVLYRFRDDSLFLQEQIWNSDQPHDLADFAPYYYYSVPYSTGDPMVYDEAARTIAHWKSEITLPDLIPVS